MLDIDRLLEAKTCALWTIFLNWQSIRIAGVSASVVKGFHCSRGVIFLVTLTNQNTFTKVSDNTKMKIQL